MALWKNRQTWLVDKNFFKMIRVTLHHPESRHGHRRPRLYRENIILDMKYKNQNL